MNVLRFVLGAAALAFLALSPAWGAGEPDRALRLKQTLMAPCCWSETVDAHNSPVASELRAEIDRMVAAGLADSEIVERFKSRYGKRILAEPDGAAGVWLTVMPPVLTALGVVWVIFLLRRWTRRAPPAVTTPEVTTT